MHLIIGGAYQGKLTYAKAQYGFADDQICDCTKEKIDFSYPCVTHVEEFSYECAQNGVDPVKYFEERKSEWKDSVLICRDISGGVIPMDVKDRMWREVHGSLCQYLAKEAEMVSKLFCGLEQRLK